MTRIFSATLGAAIVLAVTPFAAHAQDVVFSTTPDSVQAQVQVDSPAPEMQSQAEVQPQANEWQQTLATPSDPSDPVVSSQWETTAPSAPDITVINVKPSKIESKADKDKAKALLQAKKKLLPPAKQKTPVGTPSDKDQSQKWEQEFLVDHVQDHQADNIVLKAAP